MKIIAAFILALVAVAVPATAQTAPPKPTSVDRVCTDSGCYYIVCYGTRCFVVPEVVVS